MPSTLRKLVHYLYTSELEMTWAEVREVLSAARKLRIPELEVLQLQGTKLVRTDSWPRLNRKCFQASDQNRQEASRSDVELLPHEPAEEKYTAAVLVLEPSNPLSERSNTERSNPLPVVAKDSNEIHIDNKPSHPSCSLDSACLPVQSSPDRQTWVCLGPVPDSSSPSVKGNGHTVQKIKLTRLKNDTMNNSPLRPAPAKTGSDTTPRLISASCEGTKFKGGLEKCFHNSGSEITSSCTCGAQKDPMQSLIKTSISKSVSPSVCSLSPSRVSSKLSKHESSTGQSNSADERWPSPNVAELPIYVSTDVLSPPNIPKDSTNQRPALSREFCSTTIGENHKRRLRIANQNLQSQTAGESQLLEDTRRLLVCESKNTLSSDSDHQYNNIRNGSPHSPRTNNAHPTEDLIRSSVCEHSSIPSPPNKQPKNTMWSPSPNVVISEDSKKPPCLVQSKITNRSTQSQDALKQPRTKCLPTRHTPKRCTHKTSKQSLAPSSHEGPAPSLVKSAVKSGTRAIDIPNSSGAYSNTLKREESFGRPAVTHVGLGTNDASKAKGRVGADKSVCMTRTEPPASSKQLLSSKDSQQNLNSVSESEEEIEVVLCDLDTIRPQSERNASSHPAALTATLTPGQYQEGSASTAKRCSSEQPKDVKKLKREELLQNSRSSRKNTVTSPDGINSVAVKEKKHNVSHNNHRRHHKDVLLPDRTLHTTGHKHHRSTEKTAALSFQKKRHDDHHHSRKDKCARKINATQTVCNPVPLPVTVNVDSKAACLKEAVSAASNSKVSVSSGDVDCSAALASEHVQFSANGPCLSGEEEEIDVGDMEWNLISEIIHTCFRPETSSDSEPEVNVVD